MFEWSEAVDTFRCWETPALTARRDALLVEQRRIETEILAVTLVLDERGQVDDSLAARDGVNLRDLRVSVETARAFDSLPEIASAAGDGRLSVDQAREAVKVADPRSDREWADRARRMSPADLSREARKQRAPSVDDTRRRHEARSLRTWWTPDRGMLEGRFALPDLQGAAFESVIRQISEKLRPAKGAAWERPDRRAADALMALVERAEGATGTVADGVRPKVVVHVPVDGPAEVAAGVLLSGEQVEQLRANATVEVAVVDDGGSVVGVSRAVHPLNPKVRRAVVQRDGKCRWPGCEARWGLEVHHLVPRSQGGTDVFTNLAAVCVPHHQRLVPHGTWTLSGNPNRPDGLTLTRCAAPGSVASRPGQPRCVGDRGASGPHDHPHTRGRTRAGPAG